MLVLLLSSIFTSLPSAAARWAAPVLTLRLGVGGRFRPASLTSLNTTARELCVEFPIQSSLACLLNGIVSTISAVLDKDCSSLSGAAAPALGRRRLARSQLRLLDSVTLEPLVCGSDDPDLLRERGRCAPLLRERVGLAHAFLESGEEGASNDATCRDTVTVAVTYGFELAALVYAMITQAVETSAPTSVQSSDAALVAVFDTSAAADAQERPLKRLRHAGGSSAASRQDAVAFGSRLAESPPPPTASALSPSKDSSLPLPFMSFALAIPREVQMLLFAFVP